MLKLVLRQGRHRIWAWAIGLMLAHTGAGIASAQSSNATPAVALYAEQSRWLCLPGRTDVCARDLDVRQIDASGASTQVPVPASSGTSDTDCFYVYPTVDFSLIPGNPDRSTSDRTAIERIAEAQAVPFRRTCRIFAPLYRQATIGAYALPEDIRRKFIAVGAADIVAAFDYYLEHYNQGRKIAFIGHSQGSEVLIDMMKARIDVNEAIRARMSIALLTGIPSFVPVGRTTGGTFSVIPVCTRAGEIGCFVSYASWEDGSNPVEDNRLPTPVGQERVCVNPAALDAVNLSAEERRTARRNFRETYLPPWTYMSGSIRNDSRTQSFTRLSNVFSGACTSTKAGYRFFSIREEVQLTDRRYGMVKLASNTSPFEVLLDPFGHLIGALFNVGLHVVDMQFPMEDMVALVKARSRGQPPGASSKEDAVNQT